MDFLELVKARYSCRDYQARGVEKDKLNYILECVRMAPSAVNKQPWKFHLVCDNKDREALQRCYGRDWFKTAPMYIIASVLYDEQWVRADGKAHGNIDLAIAVDHLCLGTTAQGLATCWVCNFDVELCRQQFNLPENEEPAVLIPLGYAADAVRPKSRKTIETIVV